MNNKLSIVAAVALSLLVPRASSAAEDGELWEVSTKMEMPEGMPEGMMGAMGGHTAKVCRGDDEREAVTKNKDMKDCEIKDLKQSGTTVKMSVSCKEGRSGKLEIVYNADRSGYKGTMRMKDPENGEMTMRMTGKKLGPCDPKKAKAEMAAKADKHKAMGDAAQAQYAEAMKKSERDQIKGCEKGLDTMNPNEFGVYASCYGKKDKDCKSMTADYEKQFPKVAAKCTEQAGEFCERYQTHEGFHKTGLEDDSRLEAAARMCGVKADNLRAKLCKSASKEEAFEFIGGHCPDQAKPLAKKHCAGRSYTVKEGDPRRVDKKWFKFCVAVAGARDRGEESSYHPQEEAPAKSTKDEAKKAAKGAAVDAFKGLFGR